MQGHKTRDGAPGFAGELLVYDAGPVPADSCRHFRQQPSLNAWRRLFASVTFSIRNWPICAQASGRALALQASAVMKEYCGKRGFFPS